MNRPIAKFIFTAAALAICFNAQAATVWSGSTVVFNKSAAGDPTQEVNQDRLTPNVWLTRGGLQGLFNAKSESFFSHFVSPADTEWANGTLANYQTLSYTDWNTWFKNINGGPTGAIGKDAVVHLKSEDIYLSIKFTSWGVAAGNFSYERSSAGSTPVAPVVTITAPAEGAVFAEPANVRITADATVTGGTVTNVAFFNGTTRLGSAQTTPFAFIAPNLAAGAHTLTAVATAGGISTTSAPVHITVVTPATVNLTPPTLNNGLFSFSYSADPGLRYVVEKAATLSPLSWTPISTNTAAGTTVQFLEQLSSDNARFFRVGRMPNP